MADSCWDIAKKLTDRIFKLDENGLPHCVDGPAVIHDNGSEEWFLNGNIHRIGGPALKYTDGREDWYENGKRHRIGGPSSNWYDETFEYHQHGELHREDGPAVIRKKENVEMWYINGKLHREDGPAVITKHEKKWYVNGNKHRLDGPAVEQCKEDYIFLDEWWINGDHLTKEEFENNREVKLYKRNKTIKNIISEKDS